MLRGPEGQRISNCCYATVAVTAELRKCIESGWHCQPGLKFYAEVSDDDDEEEEEEEEADAQGDNDDANEEEDEPPTTRSQTRKRRPRKDN